MRNSFIILLVLALVCFGAIALAYVREEGTKLQPSNSQISKHFSRSSNEEIEKDGLFFQTLVPEPTLLVPNRETSTQLPVKIGIQIRNTTKKPIRLSRWGVTEPILIKDNGTTIPLDGGNNGIKKPRESDYPLVAPDRSVTFFLEGTISWQRNQLEMGGPDGFRGYWYFRNLEPGKYKLQFRYESLSERAEVYEPQKKVLSDIWTGEVVTPLVELDLISDSK
jgi:hypothetical protein